MKIAITGASGLIGTPLVAALRARRARRRAPRPRAAAGTPRRARLGPRGRQPRPGAARRPRRRRAPRRRRGRGPALDRRRTRRPCSTAASTAPPPSRRRWPRRSGPTGAAVGQRRRLVRRHRRPAHRRDRARAGEGFLAEVCRQWEAAPPPPSARGAGRAPAHRHRAVRPGRGPQASRPWPPRPFAGAPLGSGRQWSSWISLHDEVAAIRHLLDRRRRPARSTWSARAGDQPRVHPDPQPGRAPADPPGAACPGFVLRAVLGQFADEGVLIGQRLAPAVLERSGFTFAHPTSRRALRASL